MAFKISSKIIYCKINNTVIINSMVIGNLYRWWIYKLDIDLKIQKNVTNRLISFESTYINVKFQDWLNIPMYRLL